MAHPRSTLSSSFYFLIHVLPSSRVLLLIHVLPTHPHFTVLSAFYPPIHILPLYPDPCFTLISAFYPLIRVLPSSPCFTLSFVRPSVHVLHFHPYPRFTPTIDLKFSLILPVYDNRESYYFESRPLFAKTTPNFLNSLDVFLHNWRDLCLT